MGPCMFQNLLSQMKDFEASAEPLQESLNATELAVQESSTRLHDLTAKKLELHKLQVQMSEEHHVRVNLTSPATSTTFQLRCVLTLC